MGVQRSFWYAYDNTLWGTLWGTGALNTAGDAYQQITKWIQGATITQPCAATAADPTTFTCGYSRANGYKGLAVWNTTSQKSFSVPQGFVEYRELNGNVIAISGTSVEIATTPILLETSSAF